jgi:cell division protein FtsI/penicillin-binding protein 2
MVAVTRNPTHQWRAVVKRRIVWAAVALLLWSVGIEARLVYLQVYEHAELSARAERQQMSSKAVPAKRGEILDRRGHVLAYSVDADSIYAVPSEIAQASSAAAALCGALQDCAPKEQQMIVEKFRKQRSFVYVRRQVTPEQARRVADLQLDGVGFMTESRRFYPNKELASHILGYVGVDSDGLAGVEATYDNLIKGRSGTVLVQTDARRHAFSRLERPPTTGASLELTVDEYLQHVAERELRAGVASSGAAGGSAIIMDPNTGEILALANAPTFNPNAYRDFDDNQRRNRGIQDLYEPGSTFKIVTASAALEEKVMAADALIDTSPGVIRFGSRVIDEDKHHNYGLLTFTDVLVKSSNVGAIKIGLKVGAERMSEYVRRFGFGHPSSPDFRGENAGIVWSASKLSDSALASVSMGYQVGITPVQMVTAVSVVANGGELLQPRIVRAVLRDGTRTAVPRTLVRRVINKETAFELTSIMERVVTAGTGKKAQIEGFAVAGKTGTAQKVVDGYYSSRDYNVSFVGFVPSRRPAFAIVVMVDSPHAVPAYGGTVAAPIFQHIAQAALRHYGVPPTVDAAPPILVAQHEPSTMERTATQVEHPAILPVSRPDGTPVVPDLRGLSARESLKLLAQLGLTARLRGVGVVTRQQPEAGAPIDRGSEATLWLGRAPDVYASTRLRP